ncbi:LysM peptidoglycan-binding domain-containing protein [Liquorilactobacillus satsumensis]|uniref:LysM peptidoglycan-binding domain-containing protein n=1 Tax=Liquorilactobacillus satsumensis TaxID=259059 RepID=UPI0021C26F43|nr:LysM peptidoglycan-binding domain-containing protein [Liquorilactobacillus satsumensis]MCP9329731.1 LysM peptidoglycan-binding domain-containing protein [Liquorilactobacillus satsumensis]
MTRKRSQKKNLKWLWGVVLAVVVVAVAFLGLRSNVVRAHLQNSFGDTAQHQKSEYKKQQSLARKKYGTQQTATSASTSSSAQNKQVSKAKTVTTASSSSAKQASTQKSQYQYYVVHAGDTLSAIATKYQTTTSELMQLNSLEDGTISSGTTLKVPTTSTTAATGEQSSSN